MQPATSLGVTVCALVCLFLWAIWPVFVKRTGKLRWELFYYDLILAAFAAAVAAGFTLGTFSGEITFRDNIAIVGYRQLLYAALAGGVFGLGAILFVAAVSVAGAAVAGGLTGAVTLMVSTVIAYFFADGVSTGVQFAGVAISLVLFVLIARFYAEAERLRKKDATHKTPMRRKVEAVSPGVVMTLCIVAGLGFGSFLPLIDASRASELPLTAYPIAAMFTFGMFGVGLVINLYFMNLPLQGDPVSPLAFFRVPPMLHVPGLLAGILFSGGLLAFLLILDAPVAAMAPRGVLIALLPAALGLFAVLGRAVWKEYEEAMYRTKTVLLAGGFALLAASLSVVAGYL